MPCWLLCPPIHFLPKVNGLPIAAFEVIHELIMRKSSLPKIILLTCLALLVKLTVVSQSTLTLAVTTPPNANGTYCRGETLRVEITGNSGPNNFPNVASIDATYNSVSCNVVGTSAANTSPDYIDIELPPAPNGPAGSFVLTVDINAGSVPNPIPYQGTVPVQTLLPPSLTYGNLPNNGICPYPGDTLTPNLANPPVYYSLDFGNLGLTSNGEVMINAQHTSSDNVTATSTLCPDESASVFINTQTPSNINVSLTPATTSFCEGDPILHDFAPMPSIGFFGLPIGQGISGDNSTGFLDFSNATAGTYTIEWYLSSACAIPGQVHITIQQREDPSFSYDKPTFCLFENDPNPDPNSIATAGGTFSAPPSSNAVVDPAGTVDLTASFNQGQGNYFIQYETPGTCKDSSTISVDILDLSPQFDLPAIACNNDPTLIDAIDIEGPGTFSLPISLGGGLVTNFAPHNSTVPVFNPQGASPGIYTITYDLDPTTGCQGSHTENIEVFQFPTVNSIYPATSTCQTSNSVLLAAVPQNGVNSTVYALPSGLTMDPNNYTVNPVTSQPNIYAIHLEMTTAACTSDAFVQTLEIVAPTPSSLDYGNTIFCSNATSNPQPLSNSTTGGGQFAGQSGLSINPTTGQIDLANSTHNAPLDIYHNFPGQCIIPGTLSVEIKDYNVQFGYPSDTACRNNTQFQILNLPPAPSGTNTLFTAQGPLDIDPNTGDINPSSSTPGTYQVEYQVSDANCTFVNFASQPVTVRELDNPFFTYGPSFICLGPVALQPTINQPGGVFSSNDTANCPIDVNNGTIDLTQCSPGVYAITRDMLGACPVSLTDSVDLRESENSSFNYLPDTICKLVLDPLFPEVDSLTFTTNGTFSLLSNSGLVVDTTTGELDPFFFNIGNHIIGYTTTGDCPTSTADTLYIQAPGTETFSYIGQTFCNTNQIASIDIQTLSTLNGHFEADSGITIDSLSGEIQLGLAPPGIFEIRYFSPDTNDCPNFQTATLEILQRDDTTSFSYPDTVVCEEDGLLSPILAGDTTGDFYSFPFVSFTGGSGDINLNATDPGIYEIRYILRTVCQETYLQTITVLPLDTATFAYLDTYCENEEAPFPEELSPSVGYFFADTSSPQLLVVDSISGQIQLSASEPGEHTIFYQTQGDCPNLGEFEIDIFDAPPQLSFEADSSICEGEEMTITINRGVGPEFFINDSLLATQTFVFPYTGYSEGDSVAITQRNAFQCTDTTYFHMTVHPYPFITQLDAPNTIYGGEDLQVYIESETDSTAFIWNSWSEDYIVYAPTSGIEGGGLRWGTISLDIENQERHHPGKIEFEVLPISQECVGEPDTVSIFVNPEEVPIFIPEAMTPNGDGWNDYWLIQWDDGVYPDDFSMELYSRDQGLLFTMPVLRSDWDGGGLPDGVYHWVLRDKQKNVRKSGGLTIRRDNRQK